MTCLQPVEQTRPIPDSILPRASRQLIRLLKMGYLLYLTSLTGFFISFRLAVFSITDTGPGGVQGAGFTGLGICCLTIAVIALLDARSRYQDYKRAKDLFHENGFHPRIACLFIHSRCQRDAIGVAARELGLGRELGVFYAKLGFKWFHIIPDNILKRPGIILSGRYWRKTLFESYYRSRYFSW